MATTNNTTNTAEKRVEVFIPRGYANEDPNFFVGINGVNYILPRGETSKVPAHVAEEIQRSLKAEERQYKTSEKLLEQAKQPIEM